MSGCRFVISNATNNLLKTVSMHTNTLLSKPRVVSIEPNQRCNARCLMCDCWKEKKDFLSAEELIRVIRDLESWMGKDFFLQIAGGEPLIFPGIHEIFRHCADRGILCKANTNGILLDEHNCRKLIDSGLKYLTVSLDSHIPEIHDKYRGVPGAFEKGIQGLKYLREHSDMMLGISCIIMEENVRDLEALTDAFLRLDVDRILFQPIRAYRLPVSEWKSYSYWVKDLEALDRGIEAIKRRKRTDPRIMNSETHLDIMKAYFRDPKSIINSRRCSIGYEQLGIGYKGDVTLCNEFAVIGNIQKDDIRTIWESAAAGSVRSKMAHCLRPCTSNCKRELSFREKIQKFKVFFKAGLFH